MKRRKFMKNVATVSSVTILSPQIAFGTKANSAIRLGIIGCGNRGNAVVASMVNGTNTHIIAMADLFEDKLLESKGKFNSLNTAKGGSEIEKLKMYLGSKSYLKLIEDKDVDAVLISSPAYTHPEFLAAAVAAGKHVYCEKPAATDVDGCKRVSQIGKDGNGKVSIAIGFQIRYATPYIEMVKRIQRGDIGEIVNAQVYYFGNEKYFIPPKGNSFDEYRIRNHYHYTSLSGGILLDQGIHMIDTCNWVLQKNPMQASGSGNRKGGLDFGDTYTNYQIIYEYPDNINVSFHSTKMGPHGGDVCARFIGTKGTAEAHYSRGVFIEGDNKWDGVLPSGTQPTAEQRAAGIFNSALQDADSNKVKTFIQSIETGKYLNETESAAASTLIAILGANAAVSKEIITWDEMIFSKGQMDAGLNLKQFDR